ncbi:MAG: PASTA domain-containing protein [Armatimonadota bacterium]
MPELLKQSPIDALEPTTSPGATPFLKIAHILFVDMVGYSRMKMESQAAVQVELQSLVQRTEAVREAQHSDTLLCRPTGDGMALLFFSNPLSPVHCALQIDRFLREEEKGIQLRTGARISLRMGIHTGPVLMVVDVNALSDVAGEGIVIAQRIMDCGDGGHILVSEEMAQVLTRIAPWHRYLHDIGTCRVKHGTLIHLFNLYGTLDGSVQGSFHGQAFGSGKIPHKVSSDAADRVEKALLAQEKRPPRFVAWQPFLHLLSLLVFAAVVAGIAGVLWATTPAFRNSINSVAGKPETQKPPVGHKGQKAGSGERVTTGIQRINDFFNLPGPRPAPAPTPRGPVTNREGLIPNPRIQVPNFVGMDVEEASYIASRAGMELRVSDGSAFTTEQEEGHIYVQSPRANAWVKDKNGTVYLYVRVSQGTLKPQAPSGKLSPPFRPSPEPIKEPPPVEETPVPTPTPEPEDESEVGEGLSSEATRNPDQ